MPILCGFNRGGVPHGVAPQALRWVELTIYLLGIQKEAEPSLPKTKVFPKASWKVILLENSRSEKVTLENELETLRLYLEMEIMRFGGKVAYELDVAENVSLDYLQIPPLLLQPFVENAIWHGLMHREEGGKVRVRVTQPEEQWLRVDITDDGVGPAKAAE